MTRGWACLALSGLLAGPAAWAQRDEVSQANDLLKHHQPVRALWVLATCLKKEEQALFPKPLLEECLYLGEKTAEEVVPDVQSLVTREAFPDVMAKMGITVEWEHYGDMYSYQHDYFKALSRLVPDSKYADEFTYVLMPEIANNPDWKGDITRLEKYLQNFPKGRHAQDAEMLLGEIYDNLWEYSLPGGVGDSYRADLGLVADPKAAEDFRQKAIQWYERALARGLNPGGYPDVRRRLAGIRLKQPSGFSVLISD